MAYLDTEETMRSEAEAMQRRLGPEWEVRVWENLGWYWSLRAGGITLYKSIVNSGGKPKYHALFGDGNGGGFMDWSTGGKGSEDPLEVITEAVRIAREHTDKRLAIVQEGKRILGATAMHYVRRERLMHH